MEKDFGYFTLKDGRKAYLRTVETKDAAELIALVTALDTETRYLMREPGEFCMTMEQELAFVTRCTQSPGILQLKAEVDGRIAGTFHVEQAHLRARIRHRGTVGISILREFWGLGLGRLMFERGVEWAREMGLEQLELEVASLNTRAIGLYERIGFVRYGTRPNGMKYPDGTYDGQDLMVLTL